MLNTTYVWWVGEGTPSSGDQPLCEFCNPLMQSATRGNDTLTKHLGVAPEQNGAFAVRVKLQNRQQHRVCLSRPEPLSLLFQSPVPAVVGHCCVSHARQQ